MKNAHPISMILRPKLLRDVSLGLTDQAAVGINAVTGMLLVAAICLPWLPMFTGALVAALTVLFGPLVGFIVSSLYPRVEWTVGRRLGGKPALGDLYRLFAGSFLLVGIAALLYALILLMIKTPLITTQLAASLPSLVIILCAVRNYAAGVIASQQFTGTRGIVSIVVTLVLFLVLVAGAGAGLSLLFQCGQGGGLWSLVALP